MRMGQQSCGRQFRPRAPAIGNPRSSGAADGLQAAQTTQLSRLVGAVSICMALATALVGIVLGASQPIASLLGTGSISSPRPHVSSAALPSLPGVSHLSPLPAGRPATGSSRVGKGAAVGASVTTSAPFVPGKPTAQTPGPPSRAGSGPSTPTLTTSTGEQGGFVDAPSGQAPGAPADQGANPTGPKAVTTAAAAVSTAITAVQSLMPALPDAPLPGFVQSVVASAGTPTAGLGQMGIPPEESDPPAEKLRLEAVQKNAGKQDQPTVR